MLPFPVLDDGSEERAPCYGVIAGLHAASNDVCLVLPVDCPLVTADALRDLVEAVAVPQTGPLPGAYTKEMLPELEERVERGELSLRGVNSNVLEVDGSLLLNVNTRVELMAAAVADWAREREDVQALLVVGSQARADVPADRWSDLDLILIVDDPEPYREDASWVEEFGRPVLTFLEPTPGGQRERRVLYETGEDVDFPLFPGLRLEQLERARAPLSCWRAGTGCFIDRAGLEDGSAEPPPGCEPSGRRSDFDQLATDFWYHALWAAKKLRRGEVFTAQGVPRRLHEGAARHAARVACALASTRRWTRGTRVASSSAGRIRARSPPSRRRTRTTTCATSLARSGRRSTSGRGSRRRRRGGSGSSSRSTMPTCAGGLPRSCPIPATPLRSGREARGSSPSHVVAPRRGLREDGDGRAAGTARRPAGRVYLLRDGKVWPACARGPASRRRRGRDRRRAPSRAD